MPINQYSTAYSGNFQLLTPPMYSLINSGFPARNRMDAKRSFFKGRSREWRRIQYYLALPPIQHSLILTSSLPLSPSVQNGCWSPPHHTPAHSALLPCSDDHRPQRLFSPLWAAAPSNRKAQQQGRGGSEGLVRCGSARLCRLNSEWDSESDCESDSVFRCGPTDAGADGPSPSRRDSARP
jgi:hypothetical protein